MKNIKKVSLMMAAVFMLSGSLFVANANEAPKGKRNIDPKAHAERMTERMAKEYNLTDAQKQQVLDLNQSFAEKVGDRRGPKHTGRKGNHTKEQARAERKNRADTPKPSAEEREKRMAEMKQERDNYTTQLQKIMNADQYQAFTQKQAEREQKRQERGKKVEKVKKKHNLLLV